MNAISPLASMLTIDEASAYLGMSRSSFERHVQPHVPVVHLTPRKPRYKTEDLDAWLATPIILPESSTEIPLEEGVYFLQHGLDGLIKIGRSGWVRRRVLELRNASPVALRFLGAVRRGVNLRGSLWEVQLEKQLHNDLRQHRSHGEWFHNHFRVRSAIFQLLARQHDT